MMSETFHFERKYKALSISQEGGKGVLLYIKLYGMCHPKG